MISAKIAALFRWLAGHEEARVPSDSLVDDLEPYCGEHILVRRLQTPTPLSLGDHKAIHKIGARYGAEL